MHLCFVTREMPPVPPFGGIGTYTATMARALVKRGHTVDVVSRGPAGSVDRPRPGLTVTRVPSQPGGVRSVFDFALKAARAAAEIHRRDPLDAVEVPDYLGYGLFVKAALPRVPLVVRHHGGQELELVGRGRWIPLNPGWYVLAAMELASARAADAATAVSRRQAGFARVKHGFGRIPLTVIPNPVSCGPRPVRPGTGPPWRVLFVGRLDANKRPLSLVDAVAGLAKDGVDVVAELIGPDTPARGGWMSEALVAAVAPKYRHRVVLRGRLPHEDVLAAMQGATALCLPSRHEGFPMVVVEAMMLGLPVIASKGTAMDEIVVDGVTGYLVDGGDPSAIGERIRTLVQNRDLAVRMARAAQERASSLYSPDVVARLYEEEVLSVLKR